MTVEFVRSPIDSATIRWNPDHSSTVTCPGCPAEPGRIQGPYVQRFGPDDAALAEATLAAHTIDQGLAGEVARVHSAGGGS